MTAIAQGIKKQTTIEKQSALGTPGGGAGGQILRRKTSVFTAARATFDSAEIVSHHQSTGVAYGLKSVSGKIDGEASAATYKLPMAGLLECDFVAITPVVLGTDVTTQAAAPQVVDGSSAFLTGGLKVGYVVRFTGFTTTAAGNNSRNFWITALTAGNMTGIFLDGGAAMAAKAPETGSVTCTVVGKISKPPMTGHTNDYFTIEEWYSDLTKSELFTDCKAAGMVVSMPASGNASISFDFVGLGRTLGSAQVFTTPAAETTTDHMAALTGAVYVNGVATPVTGFTISVMNDAANTGAEIGSNEASDVATGRIKVTGTFTGLFRDHVLSALYDAETKIGACIVMTGSSSATADFLAFILGKIAITSDAPDDGEKQISRTYAYTAEINNSGGAALAWDQTILTVQDSAA